MFRSMSQFNLRIQKKLFIVLFLIINFYIFSDSYELLWKNTVESVSSQIPVDVKIDSQQNVKEYFNNLSLIVKNNGSFASCTNEKNYYFLSNSYELFNPNNDYICLNSVNTNASFHFNASCYAFGTANLSLLLMLNVNFNNLANLTKNFSSITAEYYQGYFGTNINKIFNLSTLYQMNTDTPIICNSVFCQYPLDLSDGKYYSIESRVNVNFSGSWVYGGYWIDESDQAYFYIARSPIPHINSSNFSQSEFIHNQSILDTQINTDYLVKMFVIRFYKFDASQNKYIYDGTSNPDIIEYMTDSQDGINSVAVTDFVSDTQKRFTNDGKFIMVLSCVDKFNKIYTFEPACFIIDKSGPDVTHIVTEDRNIIYGDQPVILDMTNATISDNFTDYSTLNLSDFIYVEDDTDIYVLKDFPDLKYENRKVLMTSTDKQINIKRIFIKDIAGNSSISLLENKQYIWYGNLNFNIQYYSNEDLTSPISDNSYLKQGIYYLKISFENEPSSAMKVSIDAEGSLNDLYEADLIKIDNYTYKYMRTIAYDPNAIGRVKEQITIENVPSLNDNIKSIFTDTVAPVVDAGADIPWTKNETTLYPTIVEENISSYNWQKISGEGTIIFDDNTTVNAKIKGINNEEDTFVINLTVTDKAGNVGSDTQAFNWDSKAPTVEAGNDITWTSLPTQLNPQITDKSPVTCLWEKIAGDGTVTFENSTLANTNVQGKEDINKSFTLSITVTDICGNVNSDTLVFNWDKRSLINVSQDDDILTSGISKYDFGSVTVGGASSPVVFTIANSGTSELSIIDVTISGDIDDFVLNKSSLSTNLSSMITTSFDIKFCPKTVGNKSAVITIQNTSTNEKNFTFTIKGTSELLNDEYEEKSIGDIKCITGYLSANPNDGSVWLFDETDSLNSTSSLVKFDSTGKEIIRTNAIFNYPNKTYINKNDNSIYIPIENKLYKYDSSGNAIYEKSDFGIISDLSINTNDNSLWLCDSDSGTFIKLDADGNELMRKSGYTNLKNIFVNKNDGTIWLIDDDIVIKLDSSGNEIFRTNEFSYLYQGTMDLYEKDNSLWLLDMGSDGSQSIVSVDSTGNINVIKSGLFVYSRIQINQSNCDIVLVVMNDIGYDDLVKYDKTGKELLRINRYKSIYDQCINQADGSVWISTATSNKLIKISKSGNELVKTIGLSSPNAISVNSSNGEAWVITNFNQDILKLDNDGNRKFEKEYRDLAGLNINSNDNTCWVMDRYNKKILKLDNNGSQILSIDKYPFLYWGSVINRNNGNLYFTFDDSIRDHYFACIDKNGNELYNIKGISNGSRAAINPLNNETWVADDSNKKIYRIDSNGNIIMTNTSYKEPYLFTINPNDGAAWLLESKTYNLLKLDNNGNTVFNAGIYGYLQAMEFNPNDNTLWFPDYSYGNVTRLDINGNLILSKSGYKYPIDESININNNSIWVVDKGNNRIVKFEKINKNLNAPSSLQAISTTSSQITLNWQDNSSNENGFIIERKFKNAVKYIQIAKVNANITSYSDKYLTDNTEYDYKLRAFNESGKSEFITLQANTIKATTFEVLYPNVNTTVITGSVYQSIKWNSPDDIKYINLKLYKSDVFLMNIALNIYNGDCYAWPLPKLEDGDDYKIRIESASNSSIYALSDNFKILQGFTTIESDLVLPDNNNNHWIPNIPGDKLKGITVNIKGKDDQDNDVTLTQYFNNIKILSPIDPYFNLTTDTATSNINKNRGTCHYGFYAVDTVTNNSYLLAEFYKNGEETNDRFRIDYNADYFYNDPEDNQTYGISREDRGYHLRVNDDGQLYFSIDNPALTTTAFAIGITDNNTGTIRPGDDMQLRFALADYQEYETAVPEWKFVAVYDKKMLWRANLFINENDFNLQNYDADALNSMNDNFDGIRDLITAQNLTDWNDLNPWIDGNTWNYVHTGTGSYVNNWNARYTAGTSGSTHSVENLTTLVIGNGGQVVNILPSTWPHRHNNDINTNTDIDGSVIYYFGASNSPHSYNDKIENWRQNIRNYFAVLNTALANWDNTYAPGCGPNHNVANAHIWENYDYNYGDIDAIPGAIRFRGGLDQGGFYDQFDVNAQNSITGYYDDYPYVDSSTIGVDCGGLVYMSVSYQGNTYDFGVRDIANGYRDWIDIDEAGTTLAADEVPSATEADNLWYIAHRIDQNTVGGSLEKVIPGDIVYYISGQVYHVAIIQSVEYSADNRSTTISQIHLIESVYGEDPITHLQFGCVTKRRTINNLNANNWRLGRLKAQN